MRPASSGTPLTLGDVVRRTDHLLFWLVGEKAKDKQKLCTDPRHSFTHGPDIQRPLSFPFFLKDMVLFYFP